ncbi:MAG TPA: hypothetical protein DD790_10645 [Erythrobacter sp.]|nr:hypothetical protein [Erythrobacter sp.]
MALVSIGARAAPATNAANGSEMAAFAGEAVSGAECLPGSAVGNAACLDTDRTDRMEQWLDGYRTRAGLLGGALALGKTWPERIESAAAPAYYVDYFDLGSAASYRFAENVLYRVDPEDASITGVAALLTGDEFVIGQEMPAGYDVYNVPYSYRTRYQDTPTVWYRYVDGYVYRVDPRTRRVTAAIDLLV